MRPPLEPETIEEIQQRLTVMWGALLTSQSMFLLVLYFIKKPLFAFDLSGPIGGSNPALAAVAAVLAISSFTLSFVLNAALRKRGAAEQNTAHVQTGLIIACAFCESISLMGFLLAFLIDYPLFFLWFALGILGIVLHFPLKKYLLRASLRNANMVEQTNEI
jgi:F0F1-type ATP synthase membrane subunit c/vacuolar-type H+-ATPase subunit K